MGGTLSSRCTVSSTNMVFAVLDKRTMSDLSEVTTTTTATNSNVFFRYTCITNSAVQSQMEGRIFLVVFALHALSALCQEVDNFRCWCPVFVGFHALLVCPFGRFSADLIAPPSVSAFTQCLRTKPVKMWFKVQATALHHLQSSWMFFFASKLSCLRGEFLTHQSEWSHISFYYKVLQLSLKNIQPPLPSLAEKKPATKEVPSSLYIIINQIERN